MAERKRTQRTPRKPREEKVFNIEEWTPKTRLGRMVKSGELASYEAVLASGLPVMEPEIVDALLPGMEHDLLLIGQSKGKFGGGQRRVFKQTQRKTKEGNKPSFATFCVIGNKNGYVGIGYGKAKETVPAREKALRNAKLNVFKIVRGAGSWESAATSPYSIPFAVSGKCGSCVIELLPAPKGKGLIVEKECAKILRLAGIENVWSRTKGQTRVKTNLIKALEKALRKLSEVKTRPDDRDRLSIADGPAKTEA